MSEIKVEIKKHFGTFATYGDGWTRELNLVSWNGGVAKYDVRDWRPDHTRMTKGITLTEQEFLNLSRLMVSVTDEILEEAENERV